MATIHWLALTFALAPLCACSGEDPEAPSEHRADAGGSASDAGAPSCESRVEALQLETDEEPLLVDVLRQEPSPPVAGDNTFWVSLAVEGNTLDVDASAISVSPRMPDHGHGTPVAVQVFDEGGGEYRLSPVNTFMPGFWEVEVQVESSDINASVSFGVCIE